MWRPTTLVALCALAATACHAELADPRGQKNNVIDAAPETDGLTSLVDAPPADGPPVDARPCEGGQARIVDPATGSCFVYFQLPLPYVQATTACTNIQATLAVIKNATTNASVRSLIGQTDAFIGATDRTTEGTYLWLDNAADPVEGGYTNWRSGEPNDGGTNGEDCAIIEGDQNGTWDDRPCAITGAAGAYAYVCQYGP